MLFVLIYMIKIKSKEEIKVLRQGGKILSRVLSEVVKKVKPGVSTEELENIACDLIKKAGGRPSFKNLKMHNGEIFPSALCISVNNEIVHAPAYPSRKLKEGDIVGLDIGMEYPINSKSKKNFPRNKYSVLGGYYTDMSRTVPVGKISPIAQKLINVTKECLDKGIKQVKPGNNLNDIGSAIQKHAESNGFFVVRDLVGHGVGYEVHEDPLVPNYQINENSKDNVILKPGMVIAIEPMVNIGTSEIEVGDDEMSILTADGSLSAHFEHTVAVTEDGYEILTK